MHLAVDAVGIKHSGGAVVLLDFLRAAVMDERLSTITVFCSPRRLRAFSLPQSDKVVEVDCPSAETTATGRMWWLLRGLPVAVARANADVLLAITGAGVAPPSIPAVVFLQQSLLFSAEGRGGFGLSIRFRLAIQRILTLRACRASQAMMVQTPTMRMLAARDLGVETDAIQVFQPSVSPLPQSAICSPQLASMRATPRDRRFLYVGNTMAHKNLETIVKAMPLLRDQIPGATLFLTAPSDHPFTAYPGVLGCGYLREPELREAYELATALLCPSLSETVSLPLLEAMSLGTPVVAADRPYARDVCGDAALFFDPTDVAAFTDAVTLLMADAAGRTARVQRGLALVAEYAAARPYERMVAAICALVTEGASAPVSLPA